MSIAPPSDIVLDVAQAADPLKLQAATAKLARMAAGAGAASPDFGAALAAAKPASKPLPSGFGLSTSAWPSSAAGQTKAGSAYQKFEAVLLQNFMQNILPKDDSLFGDAASADMVRGMMAEQLATQLAKSGRFGIARLIEAAHPASPKPASAEAPVGPPTSTPSPPAPHALAPPHAPQAAAAPALIDPVTAALNAALPAPVSPLTE